jgi:hypothetical protein
MNPPSRLEIEKFAKERFQADLERRADEYARKQAQAIAQVMSRGNRAGYLLALIECKQERLRAEILTLADAWVEAGTTYAAPLPVEAEEAFEKTAAEMAAGTLSALRGELDLMTERIGLVSVPTDGVREIGKAMKSAVGEGRLRLKTQRVKAGHMAMQRFFQNLTVRAEPLEAASSNSPAVQLVHFPSQLPEARLEAVGLAPGLIGKLSKAALTRMQAETTTFLEQYLPKLQRESNQNPIHDAELLKELVLHHYCLLGQECMAVCGSPDEFERQLWGEIAGSVRYALSKYPWLANGAMREELDSGFSFFIMRANPWADIAESDRGSTWHVGAITGEALSDLAMKLLTEARKRAAELGFDKPEATAARSTTPPNDGDKQDLGASSWDTIEISFLSDERVQIRNGSSTKTYNYGELGFVDRRNGKPNQAWVTLRALAEERGTIRVTAILGQNWPKVEKRVQEIRKTLKEHFRLSGDPIPFVARTGYQACFKVGCSRSYHS